MAAFFRPILSARMPDGTAPTIAPIANSEAIHVNSETEAWMVAFGAEITESTAGMVKCVEFVKFVEIVKFFISSWSFTGDVHDKPVPAAAALRQTVVVKQEKRKENRNKTSKQTNKIY